MAGFGSYYKGEKKKQKKGKEPKQTFSDAPTYKMPELIDKKRRSK